jgi:molybdenum cofactor biosynthesis protein B
LGRCVQAGPWSTSRDTRRASDEETEEAEGNTDGADTGAEAEETEDASPDGETGAPGRAGEAPSADAAAPDGLAYALVTVGDDRDTDPAAAVAPTLETDEERVVTRRSVASSFDAVQGTVADLVEDPEVAAVVTLGAVGVEPDDVAPEAIEPLFDKRLDGFGELYRVISHEEEGTAVVRARVTAGLVGPVPVFCLPGDPEGARRAVDQLVRTEARSIVDDAAEPEADGAGSP